MQYIVGCDIGTTSVKAVAFTLVGDILESESASYPMFHPEPGYAEQDAESIFQSVLKVISILLKKVDEGPVGIVFSSAMHGLMGLGENGRPSSPLIIWADNRSGAEADALRQSDEGKRQYERTGVPIHSMTPACKLLWVKKHQPEGLYRSWKYVGIKDYVLYRLTGFLVCDYAMAAATGLLNLDALAWDEETLGSVGVSPDQLPEVVSPYYRLTVADSEEWKSLSGITLIAGSSDGCLANLGSGAGKKGTLALTIGTSGAVRRTLTSKLLDPDMRTFCYPLDSELFIVGGPTNNGGVVFQWLKDTFFADLTFDQMVEGVKVIEPGADGLFCFPYLLGERAPLWDSSARGCFQGVSIEHTRFHFARAVMEGILLNLYSISGVLLDQESVHTIYANGGFAQNRVFVQMLADIFGVDIALNATNDAGCIGAALIGLRALDLIPDYSNIEGFVKVNEVISFDPIRHEAYRDVAVDFQKLLSEIPFEKRG